jgi:hypothetical protein
VTAAVRPLSALAAEVDPQDAGRVAVFLRDLALTLATDKEDDRG